MVYKRDHAHAFEGDHDRAILIEAGSLKLNNADVRAEPRLPFLQDFGLRIAGVPLEDGSGSLTSHYPKLAKTF